MVASLPTPKIARASVRGHSARNFGLAATHRDRILGDDLPENNLYDLDFTDDDLRQEWLERPVSGVLGNLALSCTTLPEAPRAGVTVLDSAPVLPAITFPVCTLFLLPAVVPQSPRSVNTRNGRQGVVIRTLTDGRLVVKITIDLLYWEIYTPQQLAAFNGGAV